VVSRLRRSLGPLPAHRPRRRTASTPRRTSPRAYAAPASGMSCNASGVAQYGERLRELSEVCGVDDYGRIMAVACDGKPARASARRDRRLRTDGLERTSTARLPWPQSCAMAGPVCQPIRLTILLGPLVDRAPMRVGAQASRSQSATVKRWSWPARPRTSIATPSVISLSTAPAALTGAPVPADRNPAGMRPSAGGLQIGDGCRFRCQLSVAPLLRDRGRSCGSRRPPSRARYDHRGAHTTRRGSPCLGTKRKAKDRRPR